jgi:uncharacterized protein YutE (UPF0331/DUF86 family)
MVRRDVIIIRIDKLKEYLNNLDSIKKYDKETYLSNPIIYGASERFLHLAIECLLDIANHVISDQNFRKPENNRDIFEVLFENKVINVGLKNNLSRMAGFRNILVHDYLKLNRSIVYNIINNQLQDMEDFVKIISVYI